MSTILYLNGNLYTLDPLRPRAQALAIDRASGRILAVGDNDEVRRVGGLHREIVDLRGKTVLPGFIDAHIHLLGTAYRAQQINAAACTSEEAAAALVRERAASMPVGQWILGGGWDKNAWPGRAFPTRAALDTAAPDHPVALWSKDCHLLWVNSLALQRAGITAETPDPPGGAILRDGAGEPTGILQEGAATELVSRVIEEPGPEQRRHLIAQALKELLRVGITSIHDIEGRDAYQIFKELRAAGQLQPRVCMILPRHLLPELREGGLRDEVADDWLRIGGIKIFADGTLGSQTAALLESYEGNPGNYGILATSEEEMRELVAAATDLDLTVAIHAIGDRAAHVALDAIELARRRAEHSGGESPSAAHLRYRLEHVQLITPADLERMRRLGVVASVQPYHAIADRDIAERYWGRRHRRAYAYRSMQQLGIPLALGSDAPVELFEPLRILYAATQRTDTTGQRPPWLPEEALPLAEALRGYTLGAAYAGAEEQQKGSLSVGKLGDAVVLQEDILRLPQDPPGGNAIQATIVGGLPVYGEV
jgi:predicted amidohydrolase YtcJ